MGFWNRLFGAGARSTDDTSSVSGPRPDDKLPLNESEIAVIAIGLGSPDFPMSSDRAAKFYRQINPRWSGQHSISVFRTKTVLPDDSSGLSQVTDLVTSESARAAGLARWTAMVQDFSLNLPGGPKIPAAFCTLCAANADKDAVILLSSRDPIDLHR